MDRLWFLFLLPGVNHEFSTSGGKTSTSESSCVVGLSLVIVGVLVEKLVGLKFGLWVGEIVGKETVISIGARDGCDVRNS